MESPFDSSDSAAVKSGRRSVLGAGGLVCEIGDACQSKFILQGRGVCVHLAADDRNAAVAQPPVRAQSAAMRQATALHSA